MTLSLNIHVTLGDIFRLSKPQFPHRVSRISVISVTQSHSTFCHPMECSTSGFPVHCQLPELAQTHIHRVGDAIQPSHPLSSPSPPAFNLPQHQGLFKWVNSSHQMAKVLEPQLQHQSFQWIFRTGLISLQSKGPSRVFSNTRVQKHQFFSAELFLAKIGLTLERMDSWKIQKVLKVQKKKENKSF